ncbi:hypothetical protein C2U72_27415 [Prosthecomicrobium hirschii]|uniref:MaoC family dehydratase n=1 Tax=Prosthecodimorpha hirschii TaxID=665126 RepID=UPI00112C5B55|nr:MaoC family dehydratase [Prosthecomicrobium hirschii]TPQ44766.1 hypothetical protein C2U72_27415 [Prosthecomicrobium hirschii]
MTRPAPPLPAAEIAISQDLIDGYAAVSGDFNPVHVDRAFGAASAFGSTIAHGCLPMEPIFMALQRWLGVPALPPGSTMDLRYHRPSRPGDVIRLDAATPEADPGGGTRIPFACLNQAGEKVIEGVAVLPAAVG